MKTKMDTTGVKLVGGDFAPGALERKIDTDPITKACVAEILQYGMDRKKWIIFGSGRKHCVNIRDEIRRNGISCEAVDGKTPKAERDAIVQRHKTGSLRCLVNVACFTTGYNNPGIDLLAFMRPTRSPVLYIQCVGRCLRTHPGKTDALVLDFGNVVSSLGPIDKICIAPPSKRKEDEPGEAPLKECPKCFAFCYTSARYCVACGEQFPPPKMNIDRVASDAAILSTQIRPEWLDVSDVSYTRHEKPGKPPSMRVDYLCGLKRHSEWVCFEHDGMARQKAVAWWNRRADNRPIPNSIDVALSHANDNALKQPARIAIKKNGKFSEVVGVEFT